MRILGFGTYDVRSHPRVAVLIDGLSAHGHTVEQLNYPLGVGTSGRVAALKSPRAALGFGLTLIRRWASLVTGSMRFRAAKAPDAILVGYMGHFDVLLARLLYPRTKILLDHLIFAADTAADRRLDGGAKTKILQKLDNLALRTADVIILDTPDHAQMVPEKWQEKSVVVAVGAPEVWFEAQSGTRAGAPVSDPDSPTSVVFFGLFTPLQGTPTIARALTLLAERGIEVDVTLVGTGQDESECREILSGDLGCVDVTWLDWVASADLPAFVAGFDICLGIFGDSGKALRVVPNKAYQGMAAGCALITSDTPVQRAMLGEASFVPAADPVALAGAIEALVTSPSDLERAKRCSVEQAAQAFHPYSVTTPLDKVLR